ncbi:MULTISPECIES: hypothetical protein [unclassified Halorubrum]|uniref:hypothetical protein n=1 Tax=unclassified Halorubrum TaxID=2642239 RepID=UPI0011C4AB09|nr:MULTISPECIES: hypothetical protein [unclassified Halorubrum]
MTVGVAAIAESESETPRVVLAADQLVTTRQQSAIEHEHPQTKVEEVAQLAPTVNALGIVSGSVSLGEELLNSIDDVLSNHFRQEEPNPVGAESLAKVAGEEYRYLVQQKVQSHVLSKYGFELEDLKKQHQFKDDFFEGMMAEVNQVQQTIHSNLTLLLGAADRSGAYVFEVSGGDVTGHNKLGYASIGSGQQPAESQFIQSGITPEEDLQDTLITVTGAILRAKQASGVGGDMDLGVVSSTSVDIAPNNLISQLQDIQSRIEREQREVKEEVLEENAVTWNPGQ